MDNSGGLAATNVSASSGQKVALSAHVIDAVGSHMVSGALVVAKPGSTADSGDLSQLPETAAGLAKNQLASGPIASVDTTADSASVTYTVTGSGVFPIVFIGQYETTADCSASPPFLDDASHSFFVEIQLGAVTAS